MNIPKTQKDLIQILAEQDKQIKSMRMAISRLESNIIKVSKVAERTQGTSRRETTFLKSENMMLKEQIRKLYEMLT